ANNFLKDKKIRVHIGEQIFEGTAKNIAEDGRLEIEMNGEIKLFSVGEITIEKDYY
ncbi:MAG: biotin--[acetyl-CoA-carboxylase] ligase, partial [Fusobacterium periodonticum]|nr:biotin--[acetyl-CoA-carboxylase] ligase [Fusobacterium periodonticum]